MNKFNKGCECAWEKTKGGNGNEKSSEKKQNKKIFFKKFPVW